MIWRIVIEAMLLRATAASVLTNAPFTLCKPMLHAVINTYTGIRIHVYNTRSLRKFDIFQKLLKDIV